MSGHVHDFACMHLHGTDSSWECIEQCWYYYWKCCVCWNCNIMLWGGKLRGFSSSFFSTDWDFVPCFHPKDLFPDKSTVEFGARFKISYHGTYKILINSQVSPTKKYVLVQRGCQAPIGVVSALSMRRIHLRRRYVIDFSITTYLYRTQLL